LGDVGQIEIVQANIRNPASIARAMAGAQACVNLVAVLYESGRQKFQSLHVMGARNIAEAARAEGVERFVQVSAIGADPDSPARYGRTKAMGEAAVREILPSATILRPSIVFGTEDQFFNRFAAMASLSPVLPVVGAQTRFQPVFVGDVAAAIAAAAPAPETEGRTYELGGPGVYTFKALMALMLRETGRKPLVASVPFPIASLIGAAGDLVAGLIPPPLTSDQVKMLRSDNVVAPGALTLADLGVEPTALEAILPTYLFRYRKGGQYAEAIARGA
jgi:NADH dehydrogenase